MRALVALVLGLATTIAFAPVSLFPLACLTLAALAWLWRDAATPGAAAALGFSWGLGFFLAGVSWVYVSLHDVGGLAAPLAALATFLFCGYLALYPALAAYLFRRFCTGEGYRDAGLFAAFWMLSEWLRGALLTGFPWLSLGYAQTPPSPLAGYAPILGSLGVGWIVAGCAALLAFAGRRLRAWGALAAVFVTGALLRGMDWTHPVGAPVRVALLQGNVPQSLKWRPEYLTLSLSSYLELAQGLEVDLVVLPETAIPLFFDQIPPAVLERLGGGKGLLLGAAVREREGAYVNAAVGLEGAGRQAYVKRHLVPFGEFAPPGFSWFFTLVDIPMSDFTAGPRRQPPLSLAGLTIAPTICYEDVFGAEVLDFFPHATLLINLSNTAWFGDSLAQPQHLQILAMRALENGRMALAATNTGITAAIAPDGRVLDRLPAFTRGVLRVEAQGYGGVTPYQRWGDALALIVGGLLGAPALWSRRNR
ncbi:MAG: apolipoprotein N-acyltransferase [Rhodocyclaceae bacterium]|nr:apolipoprotein N-acyltransferase [Rhodocyclaceae bacterium]